MTLVTVSAAYGAGGSELAPRLAERLGVPFLDRAIPSQVAERLAVPMAEASQHDDAVGNLLSRVAMRLAPIGQAFGAGAAAAVMTVPDEDYCRATEQIIREQAASGNGVVLGRAGALVLADAANAFHVRLTGPRERRVEQAMRLHHVDRETAERRLDDTDHARELYVKHFYRADAKDPKHYHVVIDSTAIDLDKVLDLIVLAAS
jgi:cytidylate kinase